MTESRRYGTIYEKLLKLEAAVCLLVHKFGAESTPFLEWDLTAAQMSEFQRTELFIRVFLVKLFFNLNECILKIPF